ncbi:MAG: ABC transporter permease [Myxococcales bacterium]|nr:ABC transporter permease [Myxococcales bacterium]MCB9520969.1 ABC transporter permease [Myxococcales bacterium]MCB9532618.1 ABC transporter permease [Myxococcales bacterium]
MTGLLFALRAFLYLGFVEAMSYPLAMVDRLVNAVALGIILYFGGEMVSGAIPGVEGSYFVFAMTGVALMGLFDASLTSFKFKVRHYQLNGVLEACAMTRTPLWQLLLATPAYDLVRAFGQAIVLIATGHFVAGTAPPLAGAMLATVVVMLGCATFMCLGLISASAVLVLKGGEPLTRLVSMGSLLFGGAFFPRSLLPDWLAAVGGALPLAPTLDAVRALLSGADIELAGPPIARLAISVVILAPLTAVTFRAALDRVLRDGSMAHY